MAIISGGRQLDDNTLLYIIATKAYPVGTVYSSVNDTDPAKLFGGEWELLSSSNGINSWKRIK